MRGGMGLVYHYLPQTRGALKDGTKGRGWATYVGAYQMGAGAGGRVGYEAWCRSVLPLILQELPSSAGLLFFLPHPRPTLIASVGWRAAAAAAHSCEVTCIRRADAFTLPTPCSGSAAWRAVSMAAQTSWWTAATAFGRAVCFRSCSVYLS